MVQVTGFDHIVLNVADVEVSAAWYRDKLGLELIRMEEWRRGEVLFPSLRIDATTLIDLLAAGMTGENLNDFAVVVDADLQTVIVQPGVRPGRPPASPATSSARGAR